MNRPRVVLADDHRMLREAIAGLLESQCEVVGEAADGRALLAAAADLQPQVVVLDIAMPLLNGLEAGRILKRSLPDIKLIFLTVSEDPELAAEAFRAALPVTCSRIPPLPNCFRQSRRCCRGDLTSRLWPLAGWWTPPFKRAIRNE